MQGIDFNNLCPKSLAEAISAVVDEHYPVVRLSEEEDPQAPGAKVMRLKHVNCFDERDRAALLKYCISEHNKHYPERRIESLPGFATAFYAARVVTSVRNFGYAARAAKEHAEILQPQAKETMRATMNASPDQYETYERFRQLHNARERMKHFGRCALDSVAVLESYGVPEQDKPAVAALGAELSQRMRQAASVLPEHLDKLCTDWTTYCH